MNDNETRVFENHAQDARVREVGEREGGGMPVYRTDRRELPVGEREQSNNHRSAGGAVMDRANREAAQTPLKKKGGGAGRDPIAFNWYVGGNSPAVGDGVCCTLQCSDAHCPAVVIWEG